jgi:hypothetical protein
MISHFPVTFPQTLPSHICLLPLPLPLWESSPTYSLFQHPPLLGHQTSTGPRASPPIAVREGHPLLYMYLEPWIPPCALLGWWSSLWEHWVVWPANVVLPMGLQSPSAPPALKPAPPPGYLISVWWLAPSIHICIGYLLAGPPKEQPHQVPVCKCLLITATVLGLVSVDRMEPQVGQSPDGPSFSLCSIFVPVLPLNRNISGLKILRWMGAPIPQPGDLPICWRWSLQVLQPPFLCISAKVIPVCILGAFCFLGVWYPLVAIPSSSFPQPPTTYFYPSSWSSVPLSHPFQYLTLPPYFLSLLFPSQVSLSLLFPPRWSCYSLNVGLKHPHPGLPSY